MFYLPLYLGGVTHPFFFWLVNPSVFLAGTIRGLQKQTEDTLFLLGLLMSYVGAFINYGDGKPFFAISVSSTPSRVPNRLVDV